MAITYVRDTGKVSGSNTNSINLSFGTLPSAGNFIAALFANWDGGTANTAAGGVTDNQGGTSYSRAVQSPARNGATSGIHYRENISSPSGTFTVTINPDGTGDYIEGVAVEFSGIATSSSIDQTTSNQATSNAPSSGTTSATGQADELVLAVVQVSASDANVSLDTPATTGYTNVFLNQDSNATIGGAGDYKIVAATGTQSAAWGTIAASYDWSACIATFKGAAAGGATTRGTPFGHRGTAFNGGRTFHGIIQ